MAHDKTYLFMGGPFDGMRKDVSEYEDTQELKNHPGLTVHTYHKMYPFYNSGKAVFVHSSLGSETVVSNLINRYPRK